MRLSCVQCSRRFDSPTGRAKYCSRTCSARASRARARGLEDVDGPSTELLSVVVPPVLADQVRTVVARYDQSVSGLLREYVEAVAAGRRLQLVDDDDELRGYLFTLDGHDDSVSSVVGGPR